MPNPVRTVIDVPPGVAVEILRAPCACPDGRICPDGDPFAPLCPRRAHPQEDIPMPRTVSPTGRAALMAREGCRLTAYHDSAGVPTIGVGHTGRAAPPLVAMGMTITPAEADAIFAADLAPFEQAVSRAVPASLSQNGYDACVSLAFNIGARGFAGSTVVHKLGEGDRIAAAEAFLMWEHPPELASRRRAERAQFLRSDEPPAAAQPVPAMPSPSPRLGFWASLRLALTGKAS